MDKEAATIISAVTALLVAAFSLLAAFGFDVSEAQQHSILGFAAAVIPVILIMGQIIRQYVYSQHTVEQIKDVATGKEAPPPVAS